MCPVEVENPPKSMGLIVPSKKIKIVNPDTLDPVPLGEPGELIVSSDRMVKAYWNKPEETAVSFIEIEGRKWYRTGDIVSMDERGPPASVATCDAPVIRRPGAEPSLRPPSMIRSVMPGPLDRQL